MDEKGTNLPLTDTHLLSVRPDRGWVWCWTLAYSLDILVYQELKELAKWADMGLIIGLK